MPRIVWGALPKISPCVGGPVRVRRKRSLQSEDGVEAWGLWDAGTRTIWIQNAIPVEQQWRVYYHEWCHAFLSDSGLENIMDEKGIEVLCDAMASARMCEHRARL